MTPIVTCAHNVTRGKFKFDRSRGIVPDGGFLSARAGKYLSPQLPGRGFIPGHSLFRHMSIINLHRTRCISQQRIKSRRRPCPNLEARTKMAFQAKAALPLPISQKLMCWGGMAPEYRPAVKWTRTPPSAKPSRVSKRGRARQLTNMGPLSPFPFPSCLECVEKKGELFLFLWSVERRRAVKR